MVLRTFSKGKSKYKENCILEAIEIRGNSFQIFKIIQSFDKIRENLIGGLMNKIDKEKHSIVLETSLQTFFYDQLMGLNKITATPIPNEAIYYSSIVMDKLSHSTEYFEVNDGKVRDKTLGKKLLECGHMSKASQRREFRDIGDTALLLCGFFSESFNRKIVDLNYYHEVGKVAYSRLNGIVPDAFEVDSFYDILSNTFKELTCMMTIVSQQMNIYSGHEADVIFLANQKSIKAS